MKILVADDYQDNRTLIQIILEMDGHEIIEAENGQQAIDLYLEHRPDIILMDGMMPEMNGFEAADIIKSFVDSEYIPIIFITAYDDPHVLVNALKVGGDDFIIKPFNEAVLRAKVRAHARTRDLTTEVHKKNTALSLLNQRIDQEHKIAEHILHTVLNAHKTNFPHVISSVQSASNFGGDIILACENPFGSICFLLADFTGHGLSASIGLIPISELFDKSVKEGLSISEIARILNKKLHEILPSYMFCSALIGEQRKCGKKFSYWMGGLPPGLVLGADGELIQKIESDYMPLGILEDKNFENKLRTLELQENQSLVFYSDGLTESTNPSSKMFDEVFQEKILKRKIKNFEDLKKIHKDFLCEERPEDDVSILWIKSTKFTLEVWTENLAELIPNALNWNFGFSDLKKDLILMDHVIQTLTTQPIVRSHASLIHTVLTELFSNALEHGVLKISSKIKSTESGYFNYYHEKSKKLELLDKGFVHLICNLTNDNFPKLRICIKDSGEGYSFTEQVSENNSYGRGIKILHKLCESVVVSEGGTQTEVVYNLRST